MGYKLDLGPWRGQEAKAKSDDGFVAILEVYGMNPWLLAMLKEYGCRADFPILAVVERPLVAACSSPRQNGWSSWLCRMGHLLPGLGAVVDGKDSDGETHVFRDEDD